MRYPRLFWENENGLSAEFSVYSPDYFCNVQRDVTGLSDVTAKINTISNVGQDGETETSVYLDPRTITIKGSLRSGDYALQREIIQRLNRILDPHAAGTLTYSLEDIHRSIHCRASAAPRWDWKKIRPEFTVTFFCADPYWADRVINRIRLTGQKTAFHFPFPSYSDALDQSFASIWGWPLIFGTRVTAPIISFSNESDTEVGMTWTLEALGKIVSPKLTHIESGLYLELNLTMVKGDILTVTTAYGKKRAVLNHCGVSSNVYSRIVLGSTFFQLARGINNLKFTARSGSSKSNCFVNYESRYLGVGL